MEGDKEAYLEEVSKALRRQRKTLSDLDVEKQHLEQTLKVSRYFYQSKYLKTSCTNWMLI